MQHPPDADDRFGTRPLPSLPHLPPFAKPAKTTSTRMDETAVGGFDSGACHQAFFSDPEGHALILHHRYGPR